MRRKCEAVKEEMRKERGRHIEWADKKKVKMRNEKRYKMRVVERGITGE